MANFWMYKCNARNVPHQGHWELFFADPEGKEWGSTELIPELSKARRGDVILAYQTDRNELVGVARVLELRKRGPFRDLILSPMEELRVKVRPLKRQSRAIARIPALQRGPIHTLYELSSLEAQLLLRAAKAVYRPNEQVVRREAEKALRGSGFGSPEHNRKVELAAMRFASAHFVRHNWSVRDVSKANLGYDLARPRGSSTLHVEVKGSTGSDQKFIITANERAAWERDRAYVLALVTKAASNRPTLFIFRGSNALRRFVMEPIAFAAVPRLTG